MRKIISKIAGTLLGLSLALGVGAFITKSAEPKSVKAEEEVFYTLTPANTGNNSYAGSGDATISGVTWTVGGNGTTDPWRIGGKSLSNVERTVFSKTAMNSTITKVELSVGAASSITVNSLQLTVASDSNFSNVISNVTGTFAANSTITFSHPSADAAWTSAYFKFIFNVTVTAGSNKFLEFKEASFYHEASSSTTYNVYYNLNGGSGTSSVPEDTTDYEKGAQATVLGIGDVTKSGYTFVNWSDGTNTYNAGDKVTVNSNVTLTAQWYRDDSITVVSGKESNEIYTGSSLVLTTCVTAVGDGELSFDVTSVNYLTYSADSKTITADATNTGGPLTITAHKGSQSCTFTVTVVTRPSTGSFALYSGEITEGDYVIYYSGNSMKASVASGRLEYATVTPDDNKIVNPDSLTIWHAAQSGSYWNLYNEETEKYAASTGANNKAQLLDDGTDDMSLWTVSGTETYEFVNKKNSASSVNANLRNNGTYGFACYATGTGGALSLYKLEESEKAIADTRLTTSGGSITANVNASSWDVSGFVFEVQYEDEETWNIVKPNYVVSEGVPTSYGDIGPYSVHFKVNYKGVDYYENTPFTATVTDDMTPIKSFYDGTISVPSGTSGTEDSYTYRGTVIAIEGNTYYLQDGGYGIMVYGGSKTYPTGMKVGDLVAVTSKIVNYNGYVIESNSITTTADDETCRILGDGTLPSAPIVTTAADFNSANQSTRITFNGLSRVDSGTSITWTQGWEYGTGKNGSHGLAQVQDSNGNTMWLYVSKYIDTTTGTAIINKINSITTADTFDLFQGVKAINTNDFSSVEGPAKGTAYLSIMSADNITIHSPDEDHVQAWINSYMQMNNPDFDGDGTGACRDSNYYVNAKAALNALETEHSGSKEAFQSEEQYANALARYLAWAEACGDTQPFVGNTIITAEANAYSPNVSGNNSSTIVIVVVALTSISSIGVLLVIKRKRSLVK